MHTKAIKFIMAFIFFAIITLPAISQEKGIVQGKIRIKFEPSLGYSVDNMQLSKSKSGVVLTGFKAIDALNLKYQIVSMKRVFPYSPKFEARHQKHGLDLWYDIEYNTKNAVDTVVADYQSTGEIILAERVLERVLEPYKVVPYTGPNSKTTDSNFNDPLLPKQWHYNNTGQTGGTPGADISLFDAWKITTGNPKVIVSVHDQGVDTKHDDLATNMWINEVEKNGLKNVDDDGNGFVDDIYGFNFITWTGSIEPMEHGTHVAGTISAVNNNGLGVCGIAGGSGQNDGVKIMSCQILGTTSGEIAPSYVYAADNGALISQNSWGYQNAGSYEQVVLDAIDYFIAEAGNDLMKGGVVIFAAGNDNSNLPHYPGYYKNCVTVASTGATNVRASYSNYSSNVDISAPGGDGKNDSWVLSTVPNNSYGYLLGTSMACPHVSGIAALIISKYGNQSFTKEKLLIHLLTSYDEIYNLNPNYIGMLGSGLANATLAMRTDEKKFPEKISTLSVSSIAQDFAIVKWIAPVDLDDNSASKYVLYYNQDTLIENKLDQYAYKEIVKTCNAGDTILYEISNLKALTKYYFAVKSYDRWGNPSVLSNQTFSKTNAGPKIRLFPPSITINVNTLTGPTKSSIFKIYNDGEGLLRWNATPRHSGSTISTTSFDNSLISYPNLPNILPNHVFMLDSIKATNNPITTAFQSITKRYVNSSSYLVGETDTTLSNSAAAKFIVTEDDGFNLTTVAMYLKHNQATGPIILEIYGGADLEKATLLYAQEVASTSSIDYNHVTTLTDQLYFQKGETFWIVYHIPVGNKFPLGIGREINSDDSKNCFISFNMGKTWNLFEDVFQDPRWAWAITAASTSGPISTYISLSSNSGDLVSGANQTITVTGDGSKFVNGTYKTNIVINTNDFNQALIKMPVTVNVTGQKPNLVLSDVLEIGTVVFGTTKTIAIPVTNNGLGAFSGIVYSISDPQYTFSVTPPTNIPAQSDNTISLKYKPTSVGSNNAMLTVTDSKGNKYSINLFASVVSPPIINLSPSSASYTNLTIGNQASGTFTVSNTGNYPLKYYIPSFSNGSNLTGSTPEYFHSFGYTFKRYEQPQAEATWVDIASTGVKITDYFKSNTQDYYKINLGFAFPFYGVNHDSIFITPYGVLTFDDNSTFNCSGCYNYYAHPNGMIASNWQKYNLLETGDIYFKRVPGKVIVQYSKVGSNTLHTIDIQIVVNDNGNIQLFYGNNNDWTASQYSLMQVWLENPDHNDALIINKYSNPTIRDSIRKYTAYYIENPGYKLITSVSKSYGTLPVGESNIINYSVNTSLLSEGDFTQKLAIVSNDPLNTVKHFTVNASVISGGIAKLTTNIDTIDFGKIFKGGSQKELLSIKNEGSKSIIVNSISLKNGAVFNLSGSSSLTFKPEYSNDYEVTVNTSSSGIFSDTVIITPSVGNVIKIPIKAEILESPLISSNLSSIAKTMKYMEVFDTVITITNQGQSSLEFVHNGNEWWKLDEINTKTLPSFKENSYFWKSNNKADGPAFDWIELSETGTALEFKALEGEKAWEKIPLPFTFSFYGNKYDTIYITYVTGIVIFNPSSLNFSFWMGGGFIPNAKAPNNLIAPHWGFEGPANGISKTNGVYYKLYDDKLVVQYKGMLDNFGMGPEGDYELVIFKDGNIKYQYNFDKGTPRFAPLGCVGLENSDGSDGVLIVNRANFVKDNMAIILTPSTKYKILPGQSKQFKLTIDAGKAYDGMYLDTITLQNNTPLTPNLKIPLNITIKGDATMQNPNILDFGNIKAFKTLTGLKSYSKIFELSNVGSKNFDINTKKMLKGKSTKLEIYNYAGASSGYNWVDATTSVNFTLLPKESKKFRITVTPDTLGAPKTITDSIVIAGSFTQGTQYITVNANVGLLPIMTTDKKLIAQYAETNSFIGSSSFMIGNINGKGDLSYKINLSYQREGNYSFSDITNLSQSLSLKNKSESLLVSPKSSTNLVSFNRVLEYDSSTIPYSKLGFGGGNSFVTATCFTAPNNGFTLSHVMTYYVPETVSNSQIIVKVLSGTDINTAVKLYEETFEHVISGSDNIGSFLLFKFKNVVDISPNENFFITYTYPSDVKFPQGTYLGSSIIKKRHYYYSSGWKDIADAANFNLLGWMVKAIEETHKELSWLELSEQEGTLKAKESKLITLNFKANSYIPKDNYAKIEISGDDPYNPIDNIDIFMHINTAPFFTSSPNSLQNITENSKLILDFEAKDLEGDSIVFEMINADPMYSLLNKGGGKATITYSPDYSSSGSKNLIVVVKDKFGFSNTDTLSIDVANINRLPIPQQMNDMKISLYDSYGTYNFASYFSDPDGDMLEYSIQNLNDNIAAVYQNDTTLMIVPKSLGTNIIKIFVTDNKGIKVSSYFQINVVNESIYFNPPKTFSPNSDGVNDSWSIENPSLFKQCKIQIFDSLGNIVFSNTGFDIQWDGTHNGKKLPVGTYFYNITFGDGTSKSGSISLIR